MKAILMSIRPKWVAKILNGEKTEEIRKRFPKDYRGWVYMYCTKEDSLCCIKRIDRDRYICGKDFDLRDFPHLCSGYDGKGKVVAKFRLNKVEEIGYEYREDFTSVYTDTLDTKDLENNACLTRQEFAEYLKSEVGYAIHISQLEIFDRPKELGEFKTLCKKDCSKCKHPDFFDICLLKPLTKAPQSWCYIEVEE